MTLEHVKNKVAVIAAVQDIMIVRQEWVETKAREFAEAEVALAGFRQAKATEGRLRRTERRVQFLKKVLAALQAGYIPIPRFEISGQALAIDALPLKAITAINDAQTAGVFDRIMAITGLEARRPGGRYSARDRRYTRDPIIVGIVEVGGIYEQRPYYPGSNRTERIELSPPHEEQFLVAWWRPEDLRPEDLF